MKIKAIALGLALASLAHSARAEGTFSALEGIPAQTLSAHEMEQVQGRFVDRNGLFLIQPVGKGDLVPTLKLLAGQGPVDASLLGIPRPSAAVQQIAAQALAALSDASRVATLYARYQTVRPGLSSATRAQLDQQVAQALRVVRARLVSASAGINVLRGAGYL